MTKVIIFQPTKSATQSGKANIKRWYLETIDIGRSNIDTLMGWYGQNEEYKNLRLKFSNLESAIEYAKLNELEYEVKKVEETKKVMRSYADNFRYNRIKTEI